MANRVEVFADINCPFTHTGLKTVVEQLRALDREVEVMVRSWPLEWVNGRPLAADAVAVKAAALGEQLGVDHFAGLEPAAWPATTIPALNLAAQAYEIDAATGLEVSLRLRSALFEHGLDIADPEVLAHIATECGVTEWRDDGSEANAVVQADYEEGQRRGVRGSPDFWVDGAEFFCPALDLGHDDAGALTADFDPEGLQTFINQLMA